MDLKNISNTSITTITECPSDCRNVIAKVALSINQSPTDNRVKVIEKISNEFSISKEKVLELLGIYLAIIRFFFETNDKEFNAKLVELGFPNDFINDLQFVSNRAKVVDAILTARRGEFNKLISLKWRIDISLTNRVLDKKIPASVILCLQLKDGRKYTINVNIRTFHKLRYNVALIMKEVASLKSVK